MFKCLYIIFFQGDCTITKLTRKNCQACRYKKCLEIEMRKDLVMTEEQVLNTLIIKKLLKLIWD